MPCVVLTGGPGVGKTTLLRALAARGHGVVEESARALIRERLGQGLPPRPDAEAFASELLRRDGLKYHEARGRPGWTFFDRCALEAIGMLLEAAPLGDADLQRLTGGFRFHRSVFVLPPWPEIYTTDAERDHPFAHCVAVDRGIRAWYAGLGHQVVDVPRVAVEARATWLLAALG